MFVYKTFDQFVLGVPVLGYPGPQRPGATCTFLPGSSVCLIHIIIMIINTIIIINIIIIITLQGHIDTSTLS